jgi:2'-5' RNA ligase
MHYALELALDDASAAVVRDLWRLAAEAGFPFMAESGANPHVSLAIWDEIERDAMEAAVAQLAAASPVVDVVFTGVDTFPSTRVVFLKPAPSPPLRDVQASWHRALAEHGRKPWAYYAPDAWQPHCTLAMDTGETLMAALGAAPLPLHARLVRAELIAFRPVERLMFAPLGG